MERAKCWEDENYFPPENARKKRNGVVGLYKLKEESK
jgi:hypothetical protein